MDYCNKKINFLHSKKSVRITNRIYQSDTSQLYICNDLTSSSKQYCLKILTAKPEDKAQNASINIEIVLLLSLTNEPNIVHIIDYYSTSSQTANIYFILLEYFDKGTLYDQMIKNHKDKTPFTEAQIYKIIYGIAIGIKSIHNNKYAHRDIRPENILIGNNDTMKICDFGSATNKLYDVINHNNRSDAIIDTIRSTCIHFRAPEQFELYMGYGINEKVDIYALGIILYMLLINYVPISATNGTTNNSYFMYYNEGVIGKKSNALLHNEIKKIINPFLYELMKNMLKENPKERLSINEVIDYMNNYKENLTKNFGFVKERVAFGANIGKLITSYFTSNINNMKIHINTIYITDNNLKYINSIIERVKHNMKKINKFYCCLANSILFFYASTGMKAIYLLHYIIFHSEQEILNPQNFNIDELLVLISNIFTIRNANGIVDKNENVKNVHIVKYVITYCEFIKIKIGFLRKYKNIIENNNALITSDYVKILNKTFIEDSLCLLIQTYQALSSIPFNIGIMISCLDSIAYMINEEMVSLFNLLYYVFIGFDHMNNEKTNLEKQFIQISLKATEYLDKLKKYRNDIHSNKEVIYFSNDIKEALAFIQSIRPSNGSGFSMKTHFSSTQNYFGITLNKNISTKPIESEQNNLILVDTNEKSDSSTKMNVIDFNENFNFTDNNFTDKKTQFVFGSSNNFHQTKSNSGALDLIIDDNPPFNKPRTGSGNNLRSIYNKSNSNANILMKGSNDIFPGFNSNESQNHLGDKSSVMNSTSTINNDNVINLLGDIFISDSSTKAKVGSGPMYNNYNSLFNTGNQNMQSNTSNMNSNNNFIFPNQIFNNTNVSNGGNNNNQNTVFQFFQAPFIKTQTNMSSSNPSNTSFQTPQLYNTPKQNFTEIPNNNQFWINPFPQNNPNSFNIPQQQPIYNNQQFNMNIQNPMINNPPIQNIINNQMSSTNNSYYPSQNGNGEEVFESASSQLSNINIINIVKNYNISNVVQQKKAPQKPKIDKLANDFLMGEFCKPSFQFVISSKDIKLGKNIGFGGSSEVFIADYRGTEVAVKRLRILEVKDENLKEFKREVSSLNMLRHPNLVLFMGAIAEPNNICIVTEYCAGGTLFNILHQRHDLILTWGLRLRFLQEIATGMNFLHTNDPPIIHRDLKSLNILLTSKIEKPTDMTSCKISDFGLSKIISKLDSAKEAMTGQLGTSVSISNIIINSIGWHLK